MEPTDLYRYFAMGGELLYIGISNQWAARHIAHFRGPWMKFAGYCQLETFPTRYLAERAEEAAIWREEPDFNAKILRPLPPERAGDMWFIKKQGGLYGEDVRWFSLLTTTPTPCDPPTFPLEEAA